MHQGTFYTDKDKIKLCTRIQSSLKLSDELHTPILSDILPAYIFNIKQLKSLMQTVTSSWNTI